MINFQMTPIQGGTFRMGSESGHKNETPYEVTLSSFYIGQYPVTQKEWDAVMNSNPSRYLGNNLPVTNVSWDDVQEYIQKLNTQTGKQYRLPTEAEWEFAARGGVESKGFEYAGSNNVDEVAWHCNSGNIGPYPVGQKKANELGLYDMSGNVWEWCQDWYDEYPSTPQVNPKGPDSGYDRVVRGGTWSDVPQDCHVAFRYYVSPGIHYNGALGFRLAHDFETFKN